VRSVGGLNSATHRVFPPRHRAGIEIFWPQRIKKITLRGDD